RDTEAGQVEDGSERPDASCGRRQLKLPNLPGDGGGAAPANAALPPDFSGSRGKHPRRADRLGTAPGARAGPSRRMVMARRRACCRGAPQRRNTAFEENVTMNVSRRTLLGAAAGLGLMGLAPARAFADPVEDIFPVAETTEGRIRGLQAGGIRMFKGVR